MSKTIDNIKCGNYEVVDNQGVSVTRHFTQCLEKEFADLEAKLEEKEKALAIYKRALELACFNVDCMYCSHFECRKEPYNEKHNCIECGELGLTQKHLSKYFLDLAKEKLEKGE